MRRPGREGQSGRQAGQGALAGAWLFDVSRVEGAHAMAEAFLWMPPGALAGAMA
jgi:hypothetical protein